MSIPPRFDPDERASDLWAIFLIGFIAWIAAQTLGANIGKANDVSTTAPTTQITPTQIVAVGITSSLAVIAAFAVANVRLRRDGFRKIGLTVRSFPRGILIGALACLIVLPIVFISTLLTQTFWDRIGFEHPNAHQVLRLLADAPPTLQRLMVLSAIFLTPPAEELLFRGHLQTAILRTFSRTGDSFPARWIAIIFTSLIFTAFHGELWMMPPIFCLSICLGYVYERTGNLWATILIHAAFNAINIVSFYHQMHH